jgi:hypothetical protein
MRAWPASKPETEILSAGVFLEKQGRVLAHVRVVSRAVALSLCSVLSECTTCRTYAVIQIEV